MNLPESVSNAVAWILVVGLAIASADMAAAMFERGFQVQPKPIPAVALAPIQANAPAQAAPPGLVELLATTEPADKPTKPGAKPQPGQPQSVTKAPPSNLKLRGTMAGAGGAGLAMIDVNGKTQVVSVGQSVGGMRLTRVDVKSARLENNGEIRLLEMDVDQPMGGGQVAQAAPPPTLAQPVVPQPNTAVDTSPILTQRELRNILDNPGAYAGKGFRMKPVVNDGSIIGMQVQLSSLGHPLARLGIQNGDIVKSLNDEPLNGPEALTSIYRTLRNTSSLRFEVERGGQPQTVQITLSE